VLSRAVYRKQRGRRPLTALAVLSLVTSLFVASGTVLAVHDEDFQLDGDVISSTATNVGGSAQAVDWDQIFTAAGAPQGTLPTDFTDASFFPDFKTSGTTFVTSDDTTYATGSKDTLPISGWQCNQDNNVNSKIDVMNAYTVAYTNGAGDEIQYFALERNVNTGTADVGFWFLQGEVGCTSTGSAVTFDGEHQDGDVLVVSEFSNGGVVSTINVYRWDGGANGSLNTTPIGSGVDCRDPLLILPDSACAASNKTTNGINGTITTPWLTANFKDKVGHLLRTSEFFEGGINLTDLNLGGKCFNSFLGDTRSSTSLTATLFDFAGGTTGACQSSTVTTPKESDGTTNLTSIAIPTDGTLDVKDSALITVDGADTFDATVSFSLCGPYAAASTTTCDSGGVAIGSAQAVTTSPSTVVSAAATITAAGRYCWRADFSGDSDVGVPASSDHSSGECFLVTPLQPTLVTDAIDGPIAFGQKISDTATLTGTANDKGSAGPSGSTDGSINPTVAGGAAGGTINLTVYGPDSCSTVEFTATGITVSGDGTYGGVGTNFEFTPSAPGQYVFVASYTGDDPNTLGVTATACANQPADEKVTVQQIGTDIKSKQSWFPNDTATVSAETGNLGAGGKVLFELFTNATCTGSSVYSEEVGITGGSASEEVGTDNSTYEITTGYADAADSSVGRHSWRITYTPAAADTAHTGVSSVCDAEHFNTTYTNDPGPGTDAS
jgi:hypothetical protein